jgi:effector-binding domain-containing protein
MYAEEAVMVHAFEIREHAARPTLSIQVRAPMQRLPEILRQGYDDICHYLAELGEESSGPAYAAYHNLGVREADVEFGFPVAYPLAGHGRIQAGELPGGRVATCIHRGPYAEMEPVYEALFKWLGEQGFQASGVMYEYYFNSPDDTPPERLETRIVVPLVENRVAQAVDQVAASEAS